MDLNKIKKKKKETKERIITLSTGSTILDMIISGGVNKLGGIPSGNIIDIFGPSGCGKTSILAELAASCQIHGGQVKFKDPEGRLNKEYSEVYGMDLSKNFEYSKPKTINELFEELYDWKPSTDKINLCCVDSAAALMSDLEKDSEDKMGMKRGKDFSAAMRKFSKEIEDKNMILIFSNQEREGPNGKYATTNNAVIYYSSLRIKINPAFPKSKIIKTKEISIEGKKKVKVEKVLGIISKCKVIKSSIDDPLREGLINIVFGYGIDDVRGNLEYIYSLTGEYCAIDKIYKQGSIQTAIDYIENNNYEKKLRELTRDYWRKVQQELKVSRKIKVRI